MTLDRRKAREIAQALMHARTGNNAVQIRTLSNDGSHSAPVFERLGLPNASHPGMTPGDRAASQTRKLTQTPLHAFRDSIGPSYADEAAGMANARGIPLHEMLGFNETPSTSSRPANSQTGYGRPLAVGGVVVPGQHKYLGYLWDDLFPSYCQIPSETLTFPPLAKEISEADKEVCRKTHESDEEKCYENYSYSPDVLRGCRGRAETNRDLCLRGEKELPPWNDVDADGVKFPKPPARGKKKK